MTEILKVAGLESGYGPIRVLSDLSLHVEEGETVAVLGANGAGKTTLMRSIVGLVRPSAGTVTFRGTSIQSTSTENIVRRGLTLVPEGRHAFSKMTVHDNLRMGAYARRDRSAANTEIEELLERFPILGDRRDQPAGTLSGGEQQQMVICRALVSKPSMILLDEPSLGLAPVMMDKVFALVRELRTRDGLSVLLVEQSVSRALDIADRGYVMSGGRITASGTSDELSTAAHQIEESYLGGTS